MRLSCINRSKHGYLSNRVTRVVIVSHFLAYV